MTVTTMSFPHLLAPFHALWAWVTRPRVQPQRRPATVVQPVRALRAVPRPKPRRPLRVVRVVDAGHTRDGAGRMVISGRLADVCAELDRLAEREAQAAGTPPTR